MEFAILKKLYTHFSAMKIIALIFVLQFFTLISGVCVDGIRKRREFRDLSLDEFRKFKSALLSFRTKPGTGNLTVYDNWIKIHMDATQFAHGTPQFLPWHRFYIHEIETELRKIDPNMAIPYWDWSYDAAEPLKSPLFTEQYLYYRNGPNGDCRIRCTYPNQHCLTRNYQVSGFTSFVNDISLALILNKSTSYDNFRQMLEATPHAIVHAAIGGDGGDLTTMISPNDPLFFLHHSFIDKIWWDFQQQHGRFSEYNGFHSWMPVFSWNTMDPFGKTVSQGFNLTEMCVEYVPFSKRQVMSKVGEHKFQPDPIRLPKPIPESFISMTGLTVSQFRDIESTINGIIQEANGVNEQDHIFYQGNSIINTSNDVRLLPSYMFVALVFMIIMQ